MSSSSFESAISKAVEESIVSGASCVAGRKDGKIAVLAFHSLWHAFPGRINWLTSGAVFYQEAFGKVGAEPDAGPMKLDTVMWTASCTKVSS